MERRVALLRAVNVGGTGTLRMEDLRQIAEDLGWRDVTTLGASGNLLYTAGRTKPTTDAARLATALTEAMGRPATVIVRTKNDVDALVQAQPFAGTPASVPPKWWFVGLLAEPSEAPLPPIPTGVPLTYADRLPREVCWVIQRSDRRAIDHPKRIEKALGVAMTVRNWNVVGQLAERLSS